MSSVRMKWWLVPMAVALCAVRLTGDDNTKRVSVSPADQVLPQIADGNGWKTIITIVNMDSVAAHFRLAFYASLGQPWSLNLVGRGAVNAVEGDIPVGGSVFLETADASSQTAVGWAELITANQLGGMAVFRFRPPGLQDAEAVVPFASRNDTQFYIPFDNRNGFVTSVAVVNSSTSVRVAAIQFRDTTGQSILVDAMTLQPGEHTAFSTVERFPASNGKNGIIEFVGSSAGIAALGISFNPRGAFTSVHALSGATSAGTCQMIGVDCAQVEGALVFAQDGQFLGRITSNQFAADSLGNEFGQYGSEFSPTSIFNPNGTYGSDYSSLSAFNPYAGQPPVIFIDDVPVAYLTANTSQAPQIDPRWIYPCIGRR